MSTNKTCKSYEDVFYKDLQDPKYMCAYLKTAFAEAIEDQDFNGFLVSIHHAIEANGLQKKQLAEDSGLSRQHLYRVLNGDSAPSFDKVINLLSALGVKVDLSLS